LQLLQPLQAIFYVDDEAEATYLRDCFIDEFESDQPELMVALQRDWRVTIAFFNSLDRFPDWERPALCTTSLLDQVNRMLRRLFQSKGTFHATEGGLVTVARVLNSKRLI
jgi:transposase-like protein